MGQDRHRIVGMGIIWRVITWEGKGREGGNDVRIKKHNWSEQNRQGDVKYSAEKGEAEELTLATHGYELRGHKLLEGRGVQGRG